MNQDPTITLSLPLTQVNLILEGLGELPAKRAFDTMVQVRGTAMAQIEAQQKAALAADPLPEVITRDAV